MRVTPGQPRVAQFVSLADSPALEKRLLQQNIHLYNPNATDTSGQKVNLSHINQRLQEILKQAAKPLEAQVSQPSTTSQAVTSQPLAFNQELISTSGQDITSTAQAVICCEDKMCNTNMGYIPDCIVYSELRSINPDYYWSALQAHLYGRPFGQAAVWKAFLLL
jgi:hypothetical protein